MGKSETAGGGIADRACWLCRGGRRRRVGGGAGWRAAPVALCTPRQAGLFMLAQTSKLGCQWGMCALRRPAQVVQCAVPLDTGALRTSSNETGARGPVQACPAAESRGRARPKQSINTESLLLSHLELAAADGVV